MLFIFIALYLVVGIIDFDGVIWSNVTEFWLSKFSNIILLEKEPWPWSPKLRVRVSNTNMFDIQSGVTNCKMKLVFNDK